MKFVFFAVLLVAWFGAHWYVWRRASSVFGLRAVGRFILGMMLFLASIAWPVARSLHRLADTVAVQVFQDAGAVWMGFVCVLLLALIAVDLLVLLPVWVGFCRRAVSTGMRAVARKASLAMATVAAVVLTAVAYGNTRGPVVVTSLEVTSPALPPGLDGLTVLFLSDVHQGGLVGRADLDRIENAVLAAPFDLLLFGGDLTDQENGDGPTFRRMAQWAQHSSMGLAVAVTGNHDRYSGGEAVVSSMRNMGMIVLRQEHLCLPEGLCVAGVDDPAMIPEGRASDLALLDALEGVEQDSFTILLSHQPILVELAASAGVDLMLSGHTHHGQFPPATFFTPLVYSHWAGVYRVRDMFIYVTSGAGFWGPPLRLGSMSEVARITLRRAAAD